MELSIIVPVYNVEAYIKECISSLLTIKNIDYEIIIVDDGTTDNSIEIIKKCFQNERINIISQNNKGLSGARNTGMLHSKGKYILFVDSDDYIINSENISKMIDIANTENSDIVVANGVKLFDNDRIEDIYNDQALRKVSNMKGKDFFKYTLKNKCYQDAVWLNLYNRLFLIENNFFFTENLLHEDFDFTPRVFYQSKKITYYPGKFYVYRQRQGSITNAKNKELNSKSLIKICEKYFLEIETYEDKELIQLFNNYLERVYYNSFIIGKDSNPNFFKQFKFNVIRKEIINNCSNKKIYLFFLFPNSYYALLSMKKKLKELTKLNIIDIF